MDTKTHDPVSITLSTRELQHLLKEVTQAVPAGSPSLPIFTGLLLRTDSDTLLVTGGDEQRSLSRRIEHTGLPLAPVLVPARMLRDTVNLHAASGRSMLTVDQCHVTVSQGGRRTRLLQLPAQAYPPPPSPAAPGFTMTGGQLTRIASQVAPFARAPEGTDQAHTDVHLVTDCGGLRSVATDRRRLAILDIPVTCANGRGNLDVMVPASALRLAAKTLTRSTGEIIVSLSGEHLVMTTPDGQLTAKISDHAPFPSFEPVLEHVSPLAVTVDRDRLLTELKPIALITKGRLPVHLNIEHGEPGELGLQAGTEEARAIGSVPADGDHDPPRGAAFDTEYLREALRTFPAGAVSIGFGTELGPAMITSPVAPGLRHLLMSIRTSG